MIMFSKSEQPLENHVSCSPHTLALWSLLLGGSGICPLMASVPLPVVREIQAERALPHSIVPARTEGTISSERIILTLFLEKKTLRNTLLFLCTKQKGAAFHGRQWALHFFL